MSLLRALLQTIHEIRDDFVDGATAIHPAYNPRLLGVSMKLQNTLGGNIRWVILLVQYVV